MSIISPTEPLYNSIVFYIIIIIILLITKPEIIYSKKNERLKKFGSSKEESLLPLPVLSISISVILYIIFSFIKVLHEKLYNQENS